jgi:hypothetical protein
MTDSLFSPGTSTETKPCEGHKSGPSSENEFVGTLIMDLQPPELWENKNLLF